ncbi:MAG: hypothetical protein ACLPKB_12630 [Xanthobacteraceae bacterium]
MAVSGIAPLFIITCEPNARPKCHRRVDPQRPAGVKPPLLVISC